VLHPSAYLTSSSRFFQDAQTPVIEPAPLLVVWTLTLSSESKGPSLIACAARLHRDVLPLPISSALPRKLCAADQHQSRSRPGEVAIERNRVGRKSGHVRDSTAAALSC
jgi:hypothetical protein